MTITDEKSCRGVVVIVLGQDDLYACMSTMQANDECLLGLGYITETKNELHVNSHLIYMK